MFTAPTEAFFVRLKIAVGAGFVIAFPVFLYQAWRFVEVALDFRERSLVVRVLPLSCLLFFAGMALALFGVVPLAVHFLLDFSSPHLRPMISLNAYLSFVVWMVVAFGLFFQLPLVVVVLCRAGVVTPDALASYRRQVIVAILILSAMLTPGPDVLSLLILSVPSYLLFEVSLAFARRFTPKNQPVLESD